MGHFNGRLKDAVQAAAEKARGQEGAFYDIAKFYKFFDVADTENGLTDWQRAGFLMLTSTGLVHFAVHLLTCWSISSQMMNTVL